MNKLNLGAGARPLEGYRNIDAKNNHGSKSQKIFPLPDKDGTVDEIRASHVLEHFSHREVTAVVADWVRALKPGGVLKIGDRCGQVGWVKGGDGGDDRLGDPAGACCDLAGGLLGCGQGLGLVEEHVLLLGAACFALGGEELAQNLVKPLLQKVALGAHKAQF